MEKNHRNSALHLFGASVMIFGVGWGGSFWNQVPGLESPAKRARPTGFAWVPMDPHGFPWVPMGPHGSHGTPWGPHGVPMGSPWGTHGLHGKSKISAIMDFNETHYSVRQNRGTTGSSSIRNTFPLHPVTSKRPESPYGAKYCFLAENPVFQFFGL